MSSTIDPAPIEAQLLADVAKAADLASLEAVRVQALGKKGQISELLASLGTMKPEERRTFGQTVNAVKVRVTEAIEARKGELGRAEVTARLARERADVTLPVRLGGMADGRIHPISQVYDEIIEIFADMGFSVAEGPDIETDDLNFTKLNIPPEHPARQEHDT
ncbi:MAG TPA: phenylalanine--tRNA ligase subunit alpha, partial [Hyphomicrobiaceae bacterium]|nr:phenylalanine--tRNA ligase subunit alpha [Hyphomicrobiaceae bacterium]